MKLKTIQHSPFPSIEDMRTVNLVFSKAEIAALKKAVDILDKADSLVTDYLKSKDSREWHGEPCLGDLDRDLDMTLNNSHLLETLDEHGVHGVLVAVTP